MSVGGFWVATTRVNLGRPCESNALSLFAVAIAVLYHLWQSQLVLEGLRSGSSSWRVQEGAYHRVGGLSCYAVLCIALFWKAFTLTLNMHKDQNRISPNIHACFHKKLLGCAPASGQEEAAWQLSSCVERGEVISLRWCPEASSPER